MKNYTESAYSRMGLSPIQTSNASTGRRSPATRKVNPRGFNMGATSDIDSSTGRISGPRIDINMGTSGGAGVDPMALAQKKQRNLQGELELYRVSQFEKAMRDPETAIKNYEKSLRGERGQTEATIATNLNRRRGELESAINARKYRNLGV